MSAIVRQSNLFAAEDFTKIYKSFQDINFTAYDFDTIRESLIEYIRVQYPEDFNDFTADSEFIAIVELLAYLGTSLAFRNDLNARENLIDTAQRRESIVRLARMINYQPKRNIAASGLMKVRSLSTTEQVRDSAGNQLSNLQISWNDPNNPNWYDQFTSILNAALNPTNPFGAPSKTNNVGGIPTDLYELNSVLGVNVAYNQTVNINGEEVPFDIVNPDVETTIVERHPDQNEAFNLIYRNDSLGVGSDNTGFFLHFKQGTLTNADFRYDFPQPNRVQELDFENINNSDVFVQEINDSGSVLTKWQKVPSVNGTNIIYNSINFNERNIFEVISGLNDTASVKFSDGNFGNVPSGIFRYWYRTSIGRNIVIRPEDANNLLLTLPYYGKDGQRYSLTITFGLDNPVANGAPAETNGQVKTRAPQTYYTQNRMVNNEDYNVFPLTYGNEIQKLRAVNRTHSGHSRYVPLRDPTGFHDGLTVLGEDGAIYNEFKNQRDKLTVSSTLTGEISLQATYALQDSVNNRNLENFFYSEYIPAFEDANPGAFDLRIETATDEYISWKTAPDRLQNETGFFIIDPTDDGDVADWPYGAGNSGAYTNIQDTTGTTAGREAYEYVKAGATVKFENPSNNEETINTSVVSINNFGQAYNPVITETGTIQLGSNVKDLWIPVRVSPVFRTQFTEDEFAEIQSEFDNSTSFALKYLVDVDRWVVIRSGFDTDAEYDYTDSSADWLVYVEYQPAESGNDPFYTFTTRGIITVFESLREVRFYWDPENVVIDSETGRAKYDTISILGINTSDNTDSGRLEKSINWDLSGVFTESDGYQDTAKVEISPTDINEDNTADNPRSFRDIVGEDDEVVFERYFDIDGYERSRPWVSAWTEIKIDTTDASPTAINTDGTILENVRVPPYGGSPNIVDIAIADYDMFIFETYDQIGDTAVELPVAASDINIPDDSVQRMLQDYVDAGGTIDIFEGKTFRVGVPGEDISNINSFYTFATVTDAENVSSGLKVAVIEDDNHYSRNGRSFTLNTQENNQESFFFKWNHYISDDQVIDPSSTNIIDMVVLTNLYYNDVLVWKSQGGSRNTMPKPPTTEDLRVQFGELNNFKSISDEIIFNSGKFKVLFGPQAEEELQATFKAVKIPTSRISDNELRTRIIQAVDQYFDINNWDFGEQFYYTELAAFIHTQLSRFLSSVVIVPRQADSEFGNLFEITARPSELFISTATVADVEIVSNFTETNLRIN